MTKEKVSNANAYAFRIKARENQIYPANQAIFLNKTFPSGNFFL
jgi:hypothetical protein